MSPAAAAGAVLQRARAGADVTIISATGADAPGARDPGTRHGTSAPEAPEPPAHVWYASYGSNLLRERFEVYLLGGRLPGLDRTYPGGPGTAPATDDQALVLPGRLRFALDAPAWGGGGVAFWDPAARGPGVLARAWRVRRGQFLEVVHLENGGADRRPAPWPGDVLRTGEAHVGDGWYARLLRAGTLAGEPLLTFTHPTPRRLPVRAPSPAYRAVVVRGVVQTFGHPRRGGLVATDAEAYVAGALEG